jgi:hypothetical protein
MQGYGLAGMDTTFAIGMKVKVEIQDSIEENIK